MQIRVEKRALQVVVVAIMVAAVDSLQVSMGYHQVAMLEVQRIQSHGTMVVCGFQVVVDLTSNRPIQEVQPAWVVGVI